MLKLLHITPHMGGGVGNVISRISSADDERIQHTVVLLERPVKDFFVDKTMEAGIDVIICPEQPELNKLLADSDITVVHWWHHPKTSKFLYELPQIPLRIVIWSHISNLTVPALNPDILQNVTRVIFTTEASYEAEVFSNIPEDVLKAKTGVVYGCGGFDNFPAIRRTEHDGFNIGYLGYIDFSKLHPDYVEFCKAVNLADAKFILAGDAPVKDIIEKQVSEKGIKNDFVFKGYVNDIIPVLSEFDVLGYPLMPYHTCTTENAILEAMAAEVPPVLLKQLVEKHIVQDGKTGILVSNIEEYGNAMRYLYKHKAERLRMGKNAREYVMKKYTVRNTLDSFSENCEIAMEIEKHQINLKSYLGETPAEWFLSCLGKDAKSFKLALKVEELTKEDKEKMLSATSPLIKQESKSSVQHYQREFPNDRTLAVWANIFKDGGVNV